MGRNLIYENVLSYQSCMYIKRNIKSKKISFICGPSFEKFNQAIFKKKWGAIAVSAEQETHDGGMHYTDPTEHLFCLRQGPLRSK